MLEKSTNKNDKLFLKVAAFIIVVLLVISFFLKGEQGAQVVVTVSGEVYGTYLLSDEQEIPIVLDGVTTNLLVIKDGEADMTEADCPDKLCVHQASISKNNEMIVCLPNEIVVQVTSSEESEVDSIAK